MCVALDGLLQDGQITNATRDQYIRHSSIPAEYLAELSGIVKTVDHALVTLDRLILFQMLYELHLTSPSEKSSLKASSGIVAADDSGLVLHGRNFDSNFFFVGRGRAMGLEDVTLDLTWKRNGSKLFTSVNTVGQIGVHTGMTLGGSPWSAQQNLRWEDESASFAEASTAARESRTETAESLEAGGKIHMTLIRSLMESQLSFKDAVLRLERSRMAARQYLVLAGSHPWDGAVIACDRASHENSMNNVQVLSQEIGRWFLVQANDDIWAETEDLRRPDAVNLISGLGQHGMTVESMVTSMRTYPTFAFNTVFTWVAIPATGERHIYMGSEAAGDVAGLSRKSSSLSRLRV